MMWWGHYGGWGWWMVGGWIWMVLFWGAIIWLVVWAVKRISRADHTIGNTPLDIAKTRYARGEISKEEFEQIKKDLTV